MDLGVVLSCYDINQHPAPCKKKKKKDVETKAWRGSSNLLTVKPQLSHPDRFYFSIYSPCSLQYTLLLLLWTGFFFFFFAIELLALFWSIITSVSLKSDHRANIHTHFSDQCLYCVMIIASFWHGWHEDVGVMEKLSDKLLRNLFPGWWQKLLSFVCNRQRFC